MKARTTFRLHASFLAVVLIILVSCKKEESVNLSKANGGAKNAAGADVDRLQWNMESLVDVYLKRGHRDPKWDQATTNVLVRFARIRSGHREWDDTEWETLGWELRDAVQNGSDDPMVLYLHAHNVVAYDKNGTLETVANAYRKAAEAMEKGQYSSLRKFYVYLRAAESIQAADPDKAKFDDVFKYRQMAGGMLKFALNDEQIPVPEVKEACEVLFDVLKKNPTQHTIFHNVIQPVLMRRWPNESFVHQTQGRYLLAQAWKSRGVQISDKVTANGWTGFRSNLLMAASAFEEAWKLYPGNARIATEMIGVELGQDNGRDRMELWFNRAMALDTNCFEACEKKLYFLEPKWYGSPEEMLSFGRECVASEEWGGDVPRILMRAHDSLAAYALYNGQTNYWKSPSVWRDIKSSLDKFFTLNPKAVGWHHNYVWYAYHCEQWDEFNNRLPLLGPINYSYFGGKETFELMLSNARERESKTP